MKNQINVLSALKHELEFLDRGGYETTMGSRQPLFCMESGVNWRQPLFFEDSPSCPKKKYCVCNPGGDCVLMGFVPRDDRHETVPCRFIPLNERGDTVESMGKTSTREATEATLRAWLVKTIGQLEKSANEPATMEP